MSDIATTIRDKTAFITVADIPAAWALVKQEWPDLPELYLPVNVDPNLGAPASLAVYPDHKAHLNTSQDQFWVGYLWHEAGHAIEWAALMRRYPDSAIWSATNAEWTAPDNSVMADFWKARGLPGTFAQSLTSGHWGGLGYEEFAESFKRLNCGAAESTDDAGIPWPGDDAMRSFFKGLFPQPAPQPIPAPAPAPTPAPQPAPAPAASSIAGVDLSGHQLQVDFDLLKTEVQFVILKATEGVGWTDPTFAPRWTEARRVGLVRGAYHFARPDLGNTPEDEADYFCNSISLEAGDFVVLDWEASYAGDVVAWNKAFLDRVYARVGARPLVYLNQRTATGYDWSPVVSAQYGLWLAAYSDPVAQTQWPFVAIRQTTSSGAVPGISGSIDLDIFYGTADQLRKYGVPAGSTGGIDMTPEEVIALIEKQYDLTNTIAALKAQQTKEVVAERDAANTLIKELQ